MKPLSERSRLTLSADVCILRARPRHSHVLVNVDYRSIAIVDCASASIVRRIDFPEAATDFVGNDWLVSPDGARSYLFDREYNDFFLQIDNESGVARCLALPPGLIRPLGLYWFSPMLHLIDWSRQAWVLEEDRLQLLEPHVAETATRRLRDRIEKFDELAPMRLNSSQQGLYLYGNDVLGYASIDASEVHLVPNVGAPIDIARLNDGLFVCCEEQVVLHEGTEESVFLNADPDEMFVAIEAVEHAGAGYLVVDSGALDVSSSTLRIFGDGSGACRRASPDGLHGAGQTHRQ